MLSRWTSRAVCGRRSGSASTAWSPSTCATTGRTGWSPGTTGSGKSELLQTLICSLALNNPPNRITFLLVDYKGGAAFRECADLPHTVGYITDLTPGTGGRAR